MLSRGRAWPTALAEEKRRMNELAYYVKFDERVKETKRGLLEFLIAAKRDGKSIVGYGAAGKTNTLLNYCGIRNGFHRLHRRSQPVQAGEIPAWYPYPDSVSRPHSGD